MSDTTVVFADLTESTALFELLGNAEATDVVTRLTRWIAAVCAHHQGKAVKFLGDGVLITFAHSDAAVDAVTELQRLHHKNLLKWSDKFPVRVKVGMARGPVLEQDGDCFGDAVNLASRLSDLAGADQIFVNEAVIDDLTVMGKHRFRGLGPIDIRGRAEPCVVFRVEWQDDTATAHMTVPGALADVPMGAQAPRRRIELRSIDITATFTTDQLPIVLGRDSEADFAVSDPRVSRLHARVEWRNGTFYLVDASSYGTWVKFQGNDTAIALRRQDCPLHSAGEIALGSSFDDFSTPIISFSLLDA